MGAYLSKPVVEKHSSDESNNILTCAASSMQGWRITQEVRKRKNMFYDLLISGLNSAIVLMMNREVKTTLAQTGLIILC